jgi:hypothetical protein
MQGEIMQKICCRCKLQKDFELFSKNSNTKDGLQTMCKSCKKDYKLSNKEKIAVKDKEYYLANKDKLFEYQRRYRKENTAKVLEYEKNYRENNKEMISSRAKKYHEENIDAISKRTKEFYLKNKDKFYKRSKQYYSENKAQYVAKANKRRAAKLQALPKWLTKAEHEEMKELYEIARMFKLYTGQEYHVDHIVPLQGKNVCGLHVPWNLQVIPASENLSKSNKLQEELL